MADATNLAGAMQESIADKPLIEALQLFLQPCAERSTDGKPDSRAHIAEIPDMVVEPLQLEIDRAQRRRACRNLDFCYLLQRLAIGDGVRAGASAADSLGDLEHVPG